MASSVSTGYSSKPLKQLVTNFDNGIYNIPAHQREFCWNSSRQEKLIQSILKKYPIPSLLMSSDAAGNISIEDGRQRLTTISRFCGGEFSIKWQGMDVHYDGLGEAQSWFDNSQILVQEFSGATDAERIEIFDNQQNGVPLTVGEKLHAQQSTSLVSLVIRLLLIPGEGFHDRAALIWGVRAQTPPLPQDKGRIWLLNATALIAGLLYGPKYATKKWESLRELLTRVITPEKEEKVKKDLVRIFEIYEEANEIVSPTKKNGPTKAHFELGSSYTGCIMFSLSAKARKAHNDSPEEDKLEFEDLDSPIYEPNSLENDEEEWDRIFSKWVDYIVSVRRKIAETGMKLKSVLEETIHKDLSCARSWTLTRWDKGYKQVFDLYVEDEGSVSEDDECGSEYSGE